MCDALAAARRCAMHVRVIAREIAVVLVAGHRQQAFRRVPVVVGNLCRRELREDGCATLPSLFDTSPW